MKRKPNPIEIENKINEQQKLTKEILTKLESIGYTAVCAGGAPRDWYRGVPAVDIDIFVECKKSASSKFHQDVETTFALELTSLEPIDNSGESTYSLNPNINSVTECKIHGQKVQFITIEDQDICSFKVDCTSIHKTFPCNLSQVQWDGTEYSFEPMFEIGIKYKIVEFYPELNSWADEEFRFSKYYRKMKRKFKDWGFVKRKKVKDTYEEIIGLEELE